MSKYSLFLLPYHPVVEFSSFRHINQKHVPSPKFLVKLPLRKLHYTPFCSETVSQTWIQTSRFYRAARNVIKHLLFTSLFMIVGSILLTLDYPLSQLFLSRDTSLQLVNRGYYKTI